MTLFLKWQLCSLLSFQPNLIRKAIMKHKTIQPKENIMFNNLFYIIIILINWSFKITTLNIGPRQLDLNMFWLNLKWWTKWLEH